MEAPVEEGFRNAALREVDALDDLRKSALEQHSHSYKWINASLLAINGGAAVSIVGNDNLNYKFQIYACASFSVGILLALLVAVASQKINIKMIPSLQRQIGYWISVVYDGERLEDFETTLSHDLKRAVRFAWLVPAIGWCSALMFVVGLFCASFAIPKKIEGVNHGQSARIGSRCSQPNDR